MSDALRVAEILMTVAVALTTASSAIMAAAPAIACLLGLTERCGYGPMQLSDWSVMRIYLHFMRLIGP